ncbi:MAG: hypothetical protein ICV68_09565, partial [Pyrinomonadaceae bacterium]|nr:hypothetical protein [Pyrinomonadaceae bacterium]
MKDTLKRLIQRAAFFSALLMALTPNVACQHKAQPKPATQTQPAAAVNASGAIWKEIPE